MAQPEFVGIDMAITLNGVNYLAQRVRVRVHGELGDLTSGGDLSKRRKGTVPDFEVTITKASFSNDANQNPFSAPLSLALFDDVDIVVIPGLGISWVFTNAIVDEFDQDTDANMLSPLSLHAVCADGTTTANWYPAD